MDEKDAPEKSEPKPLRPEEFRYIAAKQASEQKSEEERARESAVRARFGSALDGQLRHINCVDDDELRGMAVDAAVSKLAKSPADFFQYAPRDVTRLLNSAEAEARRKQAEAHSPTSEHGHQQSVRTNEAETEVSLAQSDTVEHGQTRPRDHYAKLKSGEDRKSETPNDKRTGDHSDSVEKEIGDTQLNRSHRQDEGTFRSAEREVTRPTGRTR